MFENWLQKLSIDCVFIKSREFISKFMKFFTKIHKNLISQISVLNNVSQSIYSILKMYKIYSFMKDLSYSSENIVVHKNCTNSKNEKCWIKTMLGVCNSNNALTSERFKLNIFQVRPINSEKRHKILKRSLITAVSKFSREVYRRGTCCGVPRLNWCEERGLGKAPDHAAQCDDPEKSITWIISTLAST